ADDAAIALLEQRAARVAGVDHAVDLDEIAVARDEVPVVTEQRRADARDAADVELVPVLVDDPAGEAGDPDLVPDLGGRGHGQPGQRHAVVRAAHAGG